jgi:hypothetical protein
MPLADGETMFFRRIGETAPPATFTRAVWRIISYLDVQTSGADVFIGGQVSSANAIGALPPDAVVSPGPAAPGVLEQILAVNGLAPGMSSGGAPYVVFDPTAPDGFVVGPQGEGTYRLRMGGQGLAAPGDAMQLSFAINGAPLGFPQIFTMGAVPEATFNIERDIQLVTGDVVTALWTNTPAVGMGINNFYFTVERLYLP